MYQSIFAQSTSSDAGMSSVSLLILAAVIVVAIVAYWKIFEKAGQAGWKSIIPVYNTYILLKIIGRPGWWLLLFLIPLVNIVTSIVVSFDLAKVFGKSGVFAVFGLILFSLIGYLILGFGDAEYTEPAAA